MTVEKGIWPPPVYVATFSDGATVRMSYHSPAKKPLQFDRGRRLCAQMIAAERERGMTAASEGYFASRKYRSLLRHYADRIVNAALDSLFREDCRAGKAPEFGRSSVVLFKSPLEALAPATDMIAGHVEQGGNILPDPAFSNVVEVAAKRKSPSNLEKAIAALRKLQPDERAQALAMIAA